MFHMSDFWQRRISATMAVSVIFYAGVFGAVTYFLYGAGVLEDRLYIVRPVYIELPGGGRSLDPLRKFWLLGLTPILLLPLPAILLSGILWILGFDIFARRNITNLAAYGTARYATNAEKKNLYTGGDTSLTIGSRGKGKPLFFDGPEHLLTVAPTRSGKGVSVIIPNLLTVNRSVICIDPKGEIAQITARRRESHGRWIRLLITRAMQDIERDRTKPPAPVLFILDEFATIGDLPVIKTAVGLMAGFGLQIWAFLQNWGQLEELYQRGAHTFAANAGVFQAFNVNDELTARYVSDLSGDATVAGREERRLIGSPNLYETHQRKLLTPDEAMHMNPDTLFLKIKGILPIIAEKVAYYRDRQYRGLFDPSDFN